MLSLRTLRTMRDRWQKDLERLESAYPDKEVAGSGYEGSTAEVNRSLASAIVAIDEVIGSATPSQTNLLPIGDNHPDALAVDRFAVAMKAKLAQKRAEGRGGWENKTECSADFLSQLLREHVEKGDPIDVANFCMMLHQRGERISPAPQSQLDGLERERGIGAALSAKCERHDDA